MELEAKEVPVNVYVAMRYWHPFTEEAVHQASFRWRSIIMQPTK